MLTLLSADMAGAAEWQLQATAEYAKVRVQFERPLGFFQAVKHPIVNMMILGDQTRSLVYAAACSYDTDPGASHKAAHLAKSSASDTAEFCANRATQLRTHHRVDHSLSIRVDRSSRSLMPAKSP